MIDIELHWHVKPKKVVAFCANPFSDTEAYIINDKYFLKADSKIEEQLDLSDVPVIKQIGETIEHEGKFYSFFPFIKGSTTEILNQTDVAGVLAKISISNLKKNKETLDFPDIKPYLNYFNYKFSHGDFHPANILWQDNKLKAVIDWELSGYREELYDLAFLIGCIGIKDPVELTKIQDLIKTYCDNAHPTKLSFVLLPELVLATRLKWLEKWKTTKDEEMIQMENEFIKLIQDDKEKLRNLWLNFAGTDFKYSRNKWVMQDTQMVEEINKAKERINQPYINEEQYATDLRLIQIDHGMNDDIISVLKTLNKLLNLKTDNSHVLVEKVIAMGNACLDFSKFQMLDAIDFITVKAKEIITSHEFPDIQIGYAFVLRNASIALSETGNYDKASIYIKDLITLYSNNPRKEIKGELSRALSNAITTLLNLNKPEPAKDYFSQLEELWLTDKQDKKINGAYQIAKVNLNKAGFQEEK